MDNARGRAHSKKLFSDHDHARPSHVASQRRAPASP